MTQVLPNVSTAVAVGCGYGYCRKPATVTVHIDYPATPEREAFRWTENMCDEDVQVERISATFSGATVTTEPLAVSA